MENRMKIIAPVHDALLIECDEEKAEETMLLAKKLMERANTIVLGPGHQIRTEAKIIRYPERFTDKRDTENWNRITNILEELEG